MRIRNGAGRQTPVMESIQIKRHLRLVSNAPSRALGMLAWRARWCHRWCPTTWTSYVAVVRCGLARAPFVCLAGSSSMMSLASLSFRVLLTLLIAFLLSRKRSTSCFVQKPGMMSRTQGGTHQTLTKNNFARSVCSLHPSMRLLRGNAQRNGAFEDKVVLPHPLLLAEAVFRPSAHWSIPCHQGVLSAPKVRLKSRMAVMSCRAMCSPLEPRLCTLRSHLRRRCVRRVACVMISFSSIKNDDLLLRQTSCIQFDATVGRTFRNAHRRHLDVEEDPVGR